MATSLATHRSGEFPTEIRDTPPANYICKIKSFSRLNNNKMEKYETNDFEAGGQEWRLIVYPNGNKGANVDDHISLYLSISDSSSHKLGWAVNAIFKFFVYDQIRDQYLSMQGGASRFHAMKSEWGIPKFISLKAFNEPSNGYLVDDCCVFGAEVFVIKSCEVGECLILKEPKAYKHRWLITNFSNLGYDSYSEDFTTGSTENRWMIWLGKRSSNVSMFLSLVDGHKFPPAKRVLVKYSLCVKDWYGDVHKKLEGERWFGVNDRNGGWDSFLPLSLMRSLLKQDCCIIEAEVTEISMVDEL